MQCLKTKHWGGQGQTFTIRFSFINKRVQQQASYFFPHIGRFQAVYGHSHSEQTRVKMTRVAADAATASVGDSSHLPLHSRVELQSPLGSWRSAAVHVLRGILDVIMNNALPLENEAIIVGCKQWGGGLGVTRFPEGSSPTSFTPERSAAECPLWWGLHVTDSNTSV